MKIGEATPVVVTDLWGRVESRVQKAGYLAAAGQELAKELHQGFGDSVGLARVFLTVPLGSLPADRQEFVYALARPSELAADLKSTTPVLSLIGTHGDEPEWNDLGKSRGHLGIPLISSEFVGSIPMVSRLLRELGVPLDWIDTHDADVIQKTLGESSSLFFVDDARSAKDDEGRKIIADQEFVEQHEIQSVFGIGGAYSDGAILVVMVFNHDRFERKSAEQFLPLVTLFKSNTERLVDQLRIFDED